MIYNNNLDPDEQITMEEQIASIIFDSRDTLSKETFNFDEEAVSDLSKDILKAVLTKFRPDLIEE